MDSSRTIDGARAFNRGIERDRCPHAPGTDAFKGWVAGWSRQKAEFQARQQMEKVAFEFAKAG